MSSMMLSQNSIIHSQVNDDENTDIPINISLFVEVSNDFTVDQEDINVDDLIEEYISIMDIPEEERTIEQWRRTNEILFLIYFNYDISGLLDRLKALEEERRKALEEINSIIGQLIEAGSYIDASIGLTIDYVNNLENDFNKLYETHQTLINDYETLLSNYDELINSLNLNKTIYLLAGLGYIHPKQLLVDVSFILPIKNNFLVSVGGLFLTDFSNSSGGIKLSLGYGF